LIQPHKKISASSEPKTDASKYADLRIRVIAGFSGVGLMITGTAWNQWGFFCIFSLIGLFSLLEFYKLAQSDGYYPLRTYGTVTGLLLMTSVFLVQAGWLPLRYLMGMVPLLALVFFIKLYQKDDKKPFTSIGFTFLGLVYIAFPLCLLIIGVFMKGSYSWQLSIGYLLLLWANDTGAYFAGKAFGKRALFPRISPGKTWEGSMGGLGLSLLISACVSYYFDHLQTWQWFGTGIIIVLTGTLGDLAESMLKRSIEIKDSGQSIPGHGGFLDRFDSLFLSVPFVVAFWLLF
jgi:phosphatidate cytidylyltransferase